MTPLTYTKNGNVPSDSLEVVPSFVDNEEITISFKVDDGTTISFDWLNSTLRALGLIKEDIVPIFEKRGTAEMHLRYIDKETGDEVRNDTHIYAYKGLDLAAKQGVLT